MNKMTSERSKHRNFLALLFISKGEEMVDNFLRQEVPIILNTFNRATVKGKLKTEINKKRQVVSGWVDG